MISEHRGVRFTPRSPWQETASRACRNSTPVPQRLYNVRHTLSEYRCNATCSHCDGEMASTMRRMSQAPSSHVNLHCSQCDSQIGIFDNEWTRLSSSYVHSVHPGAHFGTEVAMNKTQTVPEGTAQSKLEGCTLAEVFCTKCSGVVGQYCKAIPGPERRTML